MKLVFVLFLALSLCAFAQPTALSQSEKELVARAASYLENAESITVLFEQRTKQKAPVIVTFTDKVWQHKIAEVLRRSEGARSPLHVLCECPPLVFADLQNDRAKVTLSFPNANQISIDMADGQLDYILPGETYAALFSLAEQRRANQALLPTPMSVTPPATQEARQP